MKKHPLPHRRAAALLLAAAALPFTPSFAQEASAPVVQVAPPPPVTANPAPVATVPAAAPTPAPAMEPVVNTQPSGNEPRAPGATSSARSATRTAARPAPARARAPVRAPAPTAAAPAPAPAAVPVADPAIETALGPTPVAAPVPEPVADAAPPVASEPTNASSMIWLALGAVALIIAGAALMFLRRRRRADALYYEDSYQEPLLEPIVETAPAPVPVAEPEILNRKSGRAVLDLLMRPVRAGVNAEDAIVEFELSVGNKGSGAARDVRISTWMLSGSESSEMEGMLIERPAEAQLPQVEAGDSRWIKSAVALPTGAIDADSVLPVVVAEAHYRLDDGSEHRTSARFAVGVPLDGELAHFDVENPSGMHEDVEARQIGEPERV